MARNIEIKARIESIEYLAAKAAAIATEGPIEILQEDAFFCCDTADRGRLCRSSYGTTFRTRPAMLIST